MRIYIIGMPGTGKTYFGRTLAASMKLQFFDLDERVERQEGMYVRQIIKDKGEDYFREQERDMLINLSGNAHTVISCGGGTPMFYKNMEWMKNNGIVIWINTDLNIIAKRIANNISRRPLFMGLNEDEIREKLSDLYLKRKKIYAKADVITDDKGSGVVSLTAVIQKVMKISQRRML